MEGAAWTNGGAIAAASKRPQAGNEDTIPGFYARRPTPDAHRRQHRPRRVHLNKKLEIKNPDISTETFDATTLAIVARPTPSAPWVLV
jgi:hypothetical protein